MRFVLVSSLVLSATTASAADWTQWRGPNRDCRIEAGVTWPDSLENGHLVQKWRVPMGPSYSGPIVCGSRVFVTETRNESHEVVHAFDRDTGRELWKTEWPGAMRVPFFASANGSWIRSTPACDGEHLFVAGIRDELVCLEVESGKDVWRVDFKKRFNAEGPGFGTVCSPLLDGDALYIQAAASVLKLNKADGAVIWRVGHESGGGFGAAMGASAFSSPVIATLSGSRQLVVQSREALFGIEPESGKRLWSVEIPAFRGMNILTPHVIGDSVFTSTYGGGSFLFDVNQSTSGFTATERWQTKTQGYMSSPTTIGQHIYLHLRNQRFTCIDPANGNVKWTTEPFGKYWSMVVNGGRILALDQKGTVRLIEASPNSFNEISATKISDAETWAHLAVVDSQLFVRELNAMAVWEWK